MSETSPGLRERVLAELRRSPGRKASELAAALGVDRREVNRCLTYELAGEVHQGADYRWRLLNEGTTAPREPPATPSTEIARLCSYYLECVGQDMDDGVNAFASSQHGTPEYAELSRLPLAPRAGEWFNEPGVGRVLGKVLQDRTRLTAWLGYPVRLRRHRTSKWEGFLVEPVLLWRIELGERADEQPDIDDAGPSPNAKFLRAVAMGDPVQLADEAARLTAELGLNAPQTDMPETDELIDRLARIRPDWDWKEALDPTNCHGQVSLAELSEPGIYNRAIVVPAQRLPYTQGLESELKALGAATAKALSHTALGQWLSGSVASEAAGADTEPLLEVLPMNSEQRTAVRAALSAPLTVVTGPPGTGKSQVVTNLLVNAAFRGMRVLFASKNNKAVDVVEARVNGLGNRPVVLRLGAREYQGRLAGYMTQLLAGNPSADDRMSYDEGLARHRALITRQAKLDTLQQQTLEARNSVDRLDIETDDARRLLGDLLGAIDEEAIQRAHWAVDVLAQAVDGVDRGQQGWISRMLWQQAVRSRLRRLGRAVASATASADRLGVKLPHSLTEADVPAFRAAVGQLRQRLAAAESVVTYRRALDVLRSAPSFEEIARQRAVLADEVAQNSQRLWRDWVQLAPTRLTAAQRKDVADYAAVLQAMTGPDAEQVHPTVRKRARELQGKVTDLFTCWAVTSLSARGRVPFEPGFFDLVVIDEASQCDIASALPLLYRAKRSVIIGDPQQLRHISALTRARDSELQ
ncbi:MAG: AAA family ATPase [Burkholderiales bacterium]|nr:AAA family ATPase [Burkholderiales bacterium]